MTIEQIVCDYLKSQSVVCFTEQPDNPPDSYVLIDKTGGDEVNKLPSAPVVLQFIAPSRYKAANYADQIHAIMMNIVTVDHVGGIELNSGPYNYSDTAKKLHRYQAVYDIAYYR